MGTVGGCWVAALQSRLGVRLAGLDGRDSVQSPGRRAHCAAVSGDKTVGRERYNRIEREEKLSNTTQAPTVVSGHEVHPNAATATRHAQQKGSPQQDRLLERPA